jgi:hypothetical protein
VPNVTRASTYTCIRVDICSSKVCTVPGRQVQLTDASSSEYVRVSHCWIYRKLTFSPLLVICVLCTALGMMIARRISWQHAPLAPFPFPNPTPLLFTKTSLALVKKEGRQAGQTWHALGKRKVPQPNQLPIIICWGGGDKTRCGSEGRRVAMEIKSLEK